MDLANSSLVFKGVISRNFRLALCNTYPCLSLDLFLAKMKGNVGVIHLVQNETDIDWIVSHGKFSPYIPLLTAEMFTE